MYHPVHSRLFILSLEVFRYAKVVVVAEVPFAHCEELQHIEAVWDPSLDTDHAINLREKN